MKIIIVDDDCLVAGALKTILEANPDIQVAATGSDGEVPCIESICRISFLWISA